MKLNLSFSLYGILAVICLLPSLGNSAKILGLFTHPGKSHFDFFRPLLVGLAKAGHDVSVVSYFPNKQPIANYTDYQLTGMQIFADFVDIKIFDRVFEYESESFPLKIGTFFMLNEWGLESCTTALNSVHIKNILKSGVKYDVVILEEFNSDCMLAVAHVLKAPVISLSSCAIMPWHYKRMGSPMLLSHMPMNFLPHSEKMTFVERLNNFIHFHAVNILYNLFTQPQTNAILREHFGPTIPPIEELVKETSLFLINQHYSLAGAYPYTPNMVEVGGLQIQDEKPLDADLQKLLDNSPPKGVIYISWGSMIRPETLPDAKRDALLRGVAHFSDYLVLMKWPNDSLPNQPANLVTRPWMPQRDLLCHPKVHAFITHGGLLGTSEGVHCGVPMLVTPFYGDQFMNAKAINNRKLGLIVNYKELTETNIVSALTKLLSPSFQKPVRQVSEVYRNRPIKPLDLSIWWVEHVIATGGIPLAQSAAIELNWFIYNSLDVYLLLGSIALLVFIIGHLILKMLLSILRKLFKKTEKVKRKAD